MAVAIEIARRTELITRRIERPASETRTVRSHHRRSQGRTGFFEYSDPPRARDQNLGAAVAIVVGYRPESVVAGIEQPAAKTRAVRGHHRRGHRGACLFQNADAPGARDDYFGMAIAIHITDALRKTAGWGNNDS